MLFEFPEKALTASPVFYRTYSRIIKSNRETWKDTCTRVLKGITKVGKLTEVETKLLETVLKKFHCLPSGRWLWVGGTEWVDNPNNYYGAYNCTSTAITSLDCFGEIMNLAMCGCGTGAVLEPMFIDNLPVIQNSLKVTVLDNIGQVKKEDRKEDTEISILDNTKIYISVGDSRLGWTSSYQKLIEIASNKDLANNLEITIDLSSIRPYGELLKGFGGVANPTKLPGLYQRCAAILNKAQGRKLTSIECCLLIDEAALVVVSGNIRRSAGMRQGAKTDTKFASAKQDLWQVDANNQWSIIPEKDALRMANHTLVYHQKPTLMECIHSVTSQYYSGEGAIQWAGEAVARANADLIDIQNKKAFLSAYEKGQAKLWLKKQSPLEPNYWLDHRVTRYGLNPCGEILGRDFFCDLAEVHLNQIDPEDYEAQTEAFTAGALWVSTLLHHKFTNQKYAQSRKLDPIVGVSFTGLFDFFVKAFGIDWLHWWQQGRPENTQGLRFKEKEKRYLMEWKNTVFAVVNDYCKRHNLKAPNRCTTVQPAGSKSLLTNASPGWQPPKALRYVRRITFDKNDPVAKACLDQGYTVIPSQADKDENNNLLNDPFDFKCTEWLVEIPIEVDWISIAENSNIDPNKFSAAAQLDFYLQVQQYYTTHNTSATIELREEEIETLATQIYQAIQEDKGYISVALLSRFDSHESFPRLPFEPISKETYEQLLIDIKSKQKYSSFFEAYQQHDLGVFAEKVPIACTSTKCLS